LLEFEHIVQINDPADNKIKPLSRQQLWLGLLLRAKDPGRFNNAISCRIEETSEQGFVRYITAGGTEFREQVTLTYQQEIATHTSGAEQSIYAESLTSIEEPASGYLFVRFIYRRDLEDSQDSGMVSEHLKAAYKQIDIDAISLIRLLAEDELFDQKLN
jgi:hypothetical protein